MIDTTWNEGSYAASVASRCFWYTPYDAGWGESGKYGAEVADDEELRQLVQMERSLGPLPDWVEAIAGRDIRFVPPCGHASFPRPFLVVLDAIGAEASGGFLRTCYTADAARKRRMSDYLFLLDAWLGEAEPDAAASELAIRGDARVDWPAVCSALWGTLDERTEIKELLVARLLHRLRWWAKMLQWDDDAGDRFMVDHYLGDVRSLADRYGNDFGDPWFAELKAPRVARMAARLAELMPDWPWFRGQIECTWLCAPKAFRYLERLLWHIGQGQAPIERDAVIVPAFLQVEDTYPDHDTAAAWWTAFLAALCGWWQDVPEGGPLMAEVSGRLGAWTPLKAWLVRLYVRRLEMAEEFGELKRLVRPRAGRKRGRAEHCHTG